jgi:hypothetical protein
MSAIQTSQSRSSTQAQYHAARFYENDRSLARIVAEFLHQGFDREHRAIVVATADLGAEIVQALTDRSCDVGALQRSHELVLLDAGETLSTFMVDGTPNAQKFKDHICQIIERVCRGRTNCTVRIFGQTVDVLWQQGEREAAIRLEVLWNQLARTKAFSLLCGYAIGNFYKDAGFEDVCDQRSHIVSPDGKAKRTNSKASNSDRRRRGVRR